MDWPKRARSKLNIQFRGIFQNRSIFSLMWAFRPYSNIMGMWAQGADDRDDPTPRILHYVFGWLKIGLGIGISCKLIIGDGLYGYVCRLSIHHYGGGLRPPPQQWGGRGGKHIRTTYPQRFTYNIHLHQVLVVGRFVWLGNRLLVFLTLQIIKKNYLSILHQKSTYIGPSLPIWVQCIPYHGRQTIGSSPVLGRGSPPTRMPQVRDSGYI